MKVHLSLFLLICMGEILIIRSQNESATDKGNSKKVYYIF